MKIKHLILAFAAATLAFASCDKPTPVRPGGGTDQDKDPVAEHAGTLADPFTVADAIVFTSALGADEQSATEVYIKGVVTSIKEAFSSYGNVTLYLGDSADAAETFYVFRAYGLGNQKCTDPDAVKVGDEVVVCGKVVNFKGNTPETVQGSAYLYSINGKTGSAPVAGEPKGTGTEADPFNVAAAIAKCQEAGTTATTEVYFVTGKVTVADESGVAQYGNITLSLVDEGATAVFTAYQIFSVGGTKFTTTGNVKVGDTVVVKGQLVNYNSNTPETAKGTGELVSVNGQAPVAKPGISVKTATSINYDILEAEVAFTVNNPVAGQNVTIADIKDGGFATVTLEAAAVKVVFAAENTTENAKEVSFTLKYQGASDVTCTVTQKVKPSGDQPSFESTLTWTNGTNAYAEQEATINEQAVKVYKLSTSSKPGDATITVPAGTTKIGFYALGWKGATGTVVTIGDKTITVDGNDGVTGNAPYTITVEDPSAIYYTVEVTPGDVKVSCPARVIFWGLNPVK